MKKMGRIFERTLTRIAHEEFILVLKTKKQPKILMNIDPLKK